MWCRWSLAGWFFCSGSLCGLGGCCWYGMVLPAGLHLHLRMCRGLFDRLILDANDPANDLANDPANDLAKSLGMVWGIFRRQLLGRCCCRICRSICRLSCVGSLCGSLLFAWRSGENQGGDCFVIGVVAGLGDEGWPYRGHGRRQVSCWQFWEGLGLLSHRLRAGEGRCCIRHCRAALIEGLGLAVGDGRSYLRIRGRGGVRGGQLIGAEHGIDWWPLRHGCCCYYGRIDAAGQGCVSCSTCSAGTIKVRSARSVLFSVDQGGSNCRVRTCGRQGLRPNAPAPAFLPVG